MISQVSIYMMDIIWILCDVYEWRSKFIVFKASLRICYVSLFEYKGPSRLGKYFFVLLFGENMVSKKSKIVC